MLNILDRARADWLRLGQDYDLTFFDPTGFSVSVKGFYSDRYSGFDTQGEPVNTNIAYCRVNESLLLDASYPTRVNGRISMIGHNVDIILSDRDTPTKFKITQQYPDRTVGVLVFELSLVG